MEQVLGHLPMLFIALYVYWKILVYSHVYYAAPVLTVGLTYYWDPVNDIVPSNGYA
jgi:hypothetical protein